MHIFIGKNVLHYTLERHFMRSSQTMLENHKDVLNLLLSQIVRAKRTPLMTLMTATKECLTRMENKIGESEK